jgi:peroxiredoxin
MSQAEIAGGTSTPPNEFPSKGHLLRDFCLETTSGKKICISDYRGRSNLVLIFMDNQRETLMLASDLAKMYSEIREQEAEVLAVRPGDQLAQTGEPWDLLVYPVLVDHDGRAYAEVGAVDAHGRACSAVYIMDRFAEVFSAYRRRDGQSLPTTSEVLSWLEFVNSQCPECEPPEWPV